LEGLLNRDDYVKKSKKQNEHFEYLWAGKMKNKNENDALALILVLFCDPERIEYPCCKLFITSIKPRTAKAVLGFSFTIAYQNAF
jgi:hypothetical protein